MSHDRACGCDESAVLRELVERIRARHSYQPGEDALHQLVAAETLGDIRETLTQLDEARQEYES